MYKIQSTAWWKYLKLDTLLFITRTSSEFHKDKHADMEQLLNISDILAMLVLYSTYMCLEGYKHNNQLIRASLAEHNKHNIFKMHRVIISFKN